MKKVKAPMKILAMDTAAASCSVAIWQDNNVTHSILQEMTRGHASELLPMISNMLDEAGLSVKEMDALAVTVGPGAFTGLRIGLAAARGFGVASGLPVIGVTTLEALAFGVGKQDCPILCALDAKRADLYCQLFDGMGQACTPAQALLPENVVKILPDDCTKVVVCGDSFHRVKDLLKDRGVEAVCSDVTLPEARYVVQIAAAKGLPDADQARPSAFYIRPPDAALPKNGGRLRP